MIADCTQWPDVVEVIGLALAAAIAYSAWRFTGGKHWGER